MFKWSFGRLHLGKIDFTQKVTENSYISTLCILSRSYSKKDYESCKKLLALDSLGLLLRLLLLPERLIDEQLFFFLFKIVAKATNYMWTNAILKKSSTFTFYIGYSLLKTNKNRYARCFATVFYIHFTSEIAKSN